MPVVSINVGPKRVHLTAYCPDDELGLLWADLQRLRGTDAPLPEHFDFRMH